MKKILFLLTAVCAMLYAPPINAADYTFYVDKGDTGWTTVQCYYWDNSPASFAASPECTPVPGTTSIYKIELTNDSLKGIIFHKGEPGDNNQSQNIDGNNLKDGYLYTLKKVEGQFATWTISDSKYTPPGSEKLHVLF